MTGPLDGYRIIDTTQMISGPVATRILADQGAEVIKVEAPGLGDLLRHLGDDKSGISSTFATTNRNKRSIVLNLKESLGLELLRKLVRTADVFIQNFRPGTAERMGMGEDDLRIIKADLLYVSISGFGEKGPYRHKRVYDPIIQALSGLASIQKNRDTGRPHMVRAVIPDKLTAITAAQAVTAGLLSLARTGQGQHIRLSMLDSMLSFLWPESMSNYTIIEKEPGQTREELAQDLIFETKDGYITVGTVQNAEWKGLATGLEHPEWLEDPRFKTAADRLKNVVARLALTAEVLKTRTTGKWLEVLDSYEVPCAPVLNREEIVDSPQVIANELIVESNHPRIGRIRQARGAARFDQTSTHHFRPAPTLGEHTDEILCELGLSLEDIAILRSNQVVA